MIPLSINMNGDEAWPDLRERKFEHVKGGEGGARLELAILPGGMSSGLPSVAIRVDTPNGGPIVVVETSARLFCTAARMIMAKYPKLFEGP